MDEAREEAARYVRRKRTFFLVLGGWLTLSVMWFLIDIFSGGGIDWFYWPMLGTGIFVVIAGITLLGLGGLFGPEWERREVDRYLREHRTEDPGATE
jgi:2TM domain